MTLAQIRKALVAAAAACTITAAAIADGAVSIDEGIGIAVAWAAVYGVWKAKNATALDG